MLGLLPTPISYIVVDGTAIKVYLCNRAHVGRHNHWHHHYDVTRISAPVTETVHVAHTYQQKENAGL